MTEKAKGVRNWIILAAVGLLSVSGLALAQEDTADTQAAEDDAGPPWLRPDFEGDWTPGTPGPPPWAGKDDKDGQGPKWLREGFEGDWTPGTPGPPPWAGKDDEG
ncbi:MAG TPA: hypothetical protein VMM14_03135 [Acidimicrobiia bacterium]|nr:hypothetical protein [Acidimicrobiia bacterium]